MIFYLSQPSADVMKKLDPDGSGTITFLEFVNAYDIWTEILPHYDSPQESKQRGPKVPKLMSCSKCNEILKIG
jgi:hypothetical protein